MAYYSTNSHHLSILAELKMDRDEVLVKLVEHESIIWKRNHPQFKNVTMKEQAWGRVSYQLGISSESFFLHKHTHIQRDKYLIEHFLFCVRTPLHHHHHHNSPLHSSFSLNRHHITFRANPITWLIHRHTRDQFLPVHSCLPIQVSDFHRCYTTVLLMWRIKGVHVRGYLSVCE